MTSARNAAKRLNFTVAALKALPLPPEGKRDTYHDTKEPGLQIRVGPTGRMQFSVLKRVKNGPPGRITLGAFPDLTIEQARAKAIQIKNAIALGQDPAATLREKRSELTLGAAFEWYIEHHATPQGLKTIPIMRGNFERYLGAIPDAPRKKHGRERSKSPGSVNWENKRLSDIKPTHVAELKTSLAMKSGRAAANHALKLLRTVFNVLKKARMFDGENPAADCGVLTIQSRDRYLKKDELPRLFKVLESATNVAIRDYILLSILTGARKNNVLTMRWHDIDFDRKEWRIPDTKNGEPLVVQLPEQAIVILDGRRGGDDQWVFPGRGRTGHMLSPKRGVKSILEQAGIDNLRIHDLRRTLGSWQAITGSSLVIIGKSLGHKSVAATQIYARLSADPVRESVERAAAAMLSASVIPDNTKVPLPPEVQDTK
ncbi:MAG TPA: site-specific integrase [Burkholderiaceae bacterium]|nr:site-specific integrase [Burkholderiaceae bacterium]